MNGIISLCFANINFTCPYCGTKYSDEDEKYLNRIGKTKSGFTKIKCICGERFGLTQDIRGDLRGFVLTLDKIVKIN
jgi:hypothetical protein